MYRLCYRLKNKQGNTIGYRLLNLDNGKYIDISLTEVIKYEVINATITKKGRYRAFPGDNIRNIDIEDGININSRSEGAYVGKPYTFINIDGSRPSPKQKKLLELFKDKQSISLIKSKCKLKVNMKDLSMMTAIENVEFALFERTDKYIIFKGNATNIHLTEEQVQYLVKNKYKWIGHTHVGTSRFCLGASDGDYETLRRFGQSMSVIYNSVGEYDTFYE